MKRAKCPCCGRRCAVTRKLRRGRGDGAASRAGHLGPFRTTHNAARLEELPVRLLSRGREASRASHRPRAPGRATPGRLMGGALSAAVPVPGGLLVGLLARREPDSGWGSPFLPCRPMTISTRSTGPARHHPSAGATGPYGGAESLKYVSPLATLKSTLCVL